MKKTRPFLFAAMLLISTSVWATDPFVGKWNLNVQKSRYPKGY
jgi:hypothetical protein